MDHAIKRGYRPEHFDAIVELYESVNWTAYTREPDSLRRAYENSTYTAFAFSGDGALLGAIRSVSDDVSIHYLQDVLVRPDQQRTGLGRALVNDALDRFAHVRAHVLITDDEPRQQAFYRSLGYQNTRELTRHPLNCFVRYRAVNLE